MKRCKEESSHTLTVKRRMKCSIRICQTLSLEDEGGFGDITDLSETMGAAGGNYTSAKERNMIKRHRFDPASHEQEEGKAESMDREVLNTVLNSEYNSQQQLETPPYEDDENVDTHPAQNSHGGIM